MNATATREPKSQRWHKRHGIRGRFTGEILATPEADAVLLDHGDHYELTRLDVRPKYQGRGIGSAILQELQSRGKTIVLFPFSFEGRDADLARFYRRAGFKPDFFDEQKFVWEPSRA